LKFVSESQLNINNSLSILFYFPLVARPGKKSRHYQFHWVCAAPLEYRSLVVTNMRLRVIECVKTSVDKKEVSKK